ncbi:Circadian clock protein KaiA (fragment) [Hyella patelloides LEGE 07179]|uniref:Circadian clock oscillator protein KaiA n=1 Tax=Hyella patelloides LEGE 07179 TaxID=945734 RepID=A0A563VMV3_9CYAN
MPEFVPEDRANREKFKQNRLNSKLKERLGYSGIYSQRNYQQFFEQLSSLEQEKLLQEFKIAYYQIITDYFNDENLINEQIDRFVETAFFVNLPVDKVVKIHMELVDDLSRKLKLEGIQPDFLSDYRLALIDVIAHLGEMYRSVVKETCLISNLAS